MALFTIDAERCVRDGLCAAECPLGCVDLSGDGMPVPHARKADYCISCGHCMAVCPTGAFRLAAFDRPAVPLREIGGVPSPEQVERLLLGRRSVRAFRPDPVDRELLVRLLDLTQYAPSGHNARPVRWTVALGADKVRAVAAAVAEWMRREAEAESGIAARLRLGGIVRRWDEGEDLICRDAPALALAAAPESGITPATDAVIAAAWLELAAHGAGLGACWCGYVHLAAGRDPGVRAVLGLEDGMAAHGALMLGRPVHRCAFAPPRPGAVVRWL